MIFTCRVSQYGKDILPPLLPARPSSALPLSYALQARRHA